MEQFQPVFVFLTFICNPFNIDSISFVGIFFLSGFPYISLLLKNINFELFFFEYSNNFFVPVILVNIASMGFLK